MTWTVFSRSPFRRKRGGLDGGASWRNSVFVFSLVALFPYSCTLVFLRSAHFEQKNVIFEL